MSQNRVAGIASAFEPASGAGPAPSAVSSIASRFDSPTQTVSEPKVSEKLSDIASRFGTTVADVPAKGSRSKPPPKDSPPASTAPPPIIAERPDFSAISRRFASGRANDPDADAVPSGPGMFASAKDAFQKIEAESRPPTEGLVSQFARDIEQGKHAAKDSPAPTRAEEPMQETRVVAEEMAGVGNIKSRFEGAVGKAEEGTTEEDGAPTIENRFQSATKLFEAEKPEPKESAPAPDSKFAAASKVFAGGAN